MGNEKNISPLRIIDFSSQYGSNRSNSYAVENICAGVEIFPKYGDSTSALVFRSYGPWWIKLNSQKRLNRLRNSRNQNNFFSRDFVELEFRRRVERGGVLKIFETFNPGTLEKIYVGKELNNGQIEWHCIWKFPDEFQILLPDGTEVKIENGRQKFENYFPNETNSIVEQFEMLSFNSERNETEKIGSLHDFPPGAFFPRIVKIPIWDKIDFPTKFVRLEFDHVTAGYYIEIDTILLDTENDQIHRKEKKFETKNFDEENFESKLNLIDFPLELILLISSFLDLGSLFRFSATCRTIREKILVDENFYSLNLKSYWNKFSNETLENFIFNQNRKIRFFSLSWTKNISVDCFRKVFGSISTNLTDLELSSCQYLTVDHLETIVDFCPNIEHLNLENCFSLSDRDFFPLRKLSKLRSLNFYRTEIDGRTIFSLIEKNSSHLEDLNLGSCSNLPGSEIIFRLAVTRCPKLRSLDLWRVRFFPNENENEIRPILENFQELDLGWTNPSTSFVRNFVSQAGKNLTKIFLTACRRTNDDDIVAIADFCPNLKQLDVLGSNLINETSMEILLRKCERLEFVDLSFCSKISDRKIYDWRKNFLCSIKRSFTPIEMVDQRREFRSV